MVKNKKTNSDNFLVFSLVLLFVFTCTILKADLTVQGPSGFVQVPDHRTIKPGQVEMAVHTRMYNSPLNSRDSFLTHMAFGFSPVRDFELGIQKTMDSRNTALDPDPTLNFKVRLPSMGESEFSEVALGAVFDTNPNNYHTMYFSVGGFGLGWNFGGNPVYGVANYGSYNRAKKEPDSLCLLIGAEYPRRRPGERGYHSHYFVDYNGDIFSVGWRYRSHRGFWVDASVHSKTTYTDFYDYKPLIIGVGAIF